MSPETPLQRDMFSGKLVDTRTSAQRAQERTHKLPQQQFLFSQRDLAQHVNPHPQMPFYPYERLELMSEDPRTPEEIERDQQRAIEAQTSHLFTDYPEFYDEFLVPDSELTSADDTDETHEVALVPEKPVDTKLSLYLELVQLSEEDAQTIWIDRHYAGAYLTQIALTALKAQAVGLTQEEIGMALAIGQFIGSDRKQRVHAGEVAIKPAETPMSARQATQTVVFAEEAFGIVLPKSVF